jgi:hypothetical protein
MLLLAATSCWGGVSNEEYEVFNALLADTPRACVAEATDASASAVQALERAHFESDGIGADALRDFIARNSISVRFRRSRLGPAEVSVIAGEATPETLVGCTGRYFVFSRAGFNHDHDRAVISVASREAGAATRLVLFTKSSGVWKPLRSVEVPQS